MPIHTTRYAMQSLHPLTQPQLTTLLLHTQMYQCTQEFFRPGSSFAVKELSAVRGQSRTITFYHAARLDGLVRREERLGVKLTESFAGRGDRLECRAATFAPPAAGAAAGAAGGAAAGLAAGEAGGGGGQLQQGQQQERTLPIVKVTEKFGRDPSKPADADVAKRVFHVAAGRTLLSFHHGEGRLTAGQVVFSRDGQVQVVQVRANDSAAGCSCFAFCAFVAAPAASTGT